MADATRSMMKQLDGALTEALTLADSAYTFETQLVDYLNVNQAQTYVNLALGKQTEVAASNTDGSINSTATSAEVTAGFSIVTYTGNATEGATVGHGLSKAPDVIMLKKRSGTSGWYMYHSALGATKNIEMQVNSAASTTSNIWNDTAPTADVFSLGNNAAVNGNNATFVTYHFHSVDGYSKFGHYTGNGNAAGPFVHLGFRPMFVLCKDTDASQWLANI